MKNSILNGTLNHSIEFSFLCTYVRAVKDWVKVSERLNTYVCSKGKDNCET